MKEFINIYFDRKEAVSKERSINQGQALKNSPVGYFSEGARPSGGVSKH